jgi:hypothetical protein
MSQPVDKFHALSSSRSSPGPRRNAKRLVALETTVRAPVSSQWQLGRDSLRQFHRIRSGQIQRRIAMNPCCRQAAEDVYTSQHHPAVPLKSDFVRLHVGDAARRWSAGFLSSLIDQMYIRSAARGGDTVSASVTSVRCAQSHSVRLAVLRPRLYHLTWEMHALCATYFQESTKHNKFATAFSGDLGSWPRSEGIATLKKLLHLYETDAFQPSEMTPFSASSLGVAQREMAQLGLLFVFLHELHHDYPTELAPSLNYHVELGDWLSHVPAKRRQRWARELTCDANAVLMLLMCAAETYIQRGAAHKVARAGASVLVAPAVDGLLHTLQFEEARRLGVVSLTEAATSENFLDHPPTELRRAILSQVLYTHLTGFTYNDLLQHRTTPEWQDVANSVTAYMTLRDRLFTSL